MCESRNRRRPESDDIMTSFKYTYYVTLNLKWLMNVRKRLVQVRMKSRLAKKKSREEQIFRELFNEGLEIQKNRISEIRKYCKEKREARNHQQKNEVESLENYYRDQFAILAEAVDKEKKEVELNDRVQAVALEKMKNELRQKLESDIRLLQSQLVENEDAVQFRNMEADKMRKQLQVALFKTQV